MIILLSLIALGLAIALLIALRLWIKAERTAQFSLGAYDNLDERYRTLEYRYDDLFYKRMAAETRAKLPLELAAELTAMKDNLRKATQSLQTAEHTARLHEIQRRTAQANFENLALEFRIYREQEEAMKAPGTAGPVRVKK